MKHERWLDTGCEVKLPLIYEVSRTPHGLEQSKQIYAKTVELDERSIKAMSIVDIQLWLTYELVEGRFYRLIHKDIDRYCQAKNGILIEVEKDSILTTAEDLKQRDNELGMHISELKIKFREMEQKIDDLSDELYDLADKEDDKLLHDFKESVTDI